MATGFGFEGDLRRIADALERLADGLVGPAALPLVDSGSQFPIISLDQDYRVTEAPSGPYIAQTASGYMSAACVDCPAGRNVEIDVWDPATCLEYESGDSVDDFRAALARHVGHHQMLPDPAGPLALWTWVDQACPRCQAEPGPELRYEVRPGEHGNPLASMA